MATEYKYTTKTYRGEKRYSKDLARMSAKGWEVVNSETIPIRRGCVTTVFWVVLSIVTFGILPLIVWLLIGRPVRVVVQYRRPV